MLTNCCVYYHYTYNTNELFYIGEGSNTRAHSKRGRSKRWNYKVAKYGGFKVEIVCKDISKETAQQLEELLIAEAREEGKLIVNVLSKAMCAEFWASEESKKPHPTRGMPKPWVGLSNARRTGQPYSCNPVAAAARDAALLERIALGLMGRKPKPVICVETKEYFPSMKSAAAHIKRTHARLSEAVNKPMVTAGGYHWKLATFDEVFVEGC